MPDSRPLQGPAAAPLPAALDRLPTALLFAVFSIPLIGGVIGRTLDRGWWPDLEALVCAADRVQHGFSAFGGSMCSAGAAAYVYAPMVAQGASGVTGLIGTTGFRILYIAVYAVALVFAAYVLLARRLTHIDLRARGLFMALVTGTLITAGNVGVICHGAVLAALFLAPRRRAVFIAVVLAATLIKPAFATYFIVLLLERAPWRFRLARAAAAGSALIGLAAVVLIFDAPSMGEWGEALGRVVLSEQPGRGFLGWAAELGLNGASLAGGIVFVLLAGLLSLAGLALCERGGLSDEERLLIGAGLAQLLNPRLMTYDELLLVPMAALVCSIAWRISKPWGDTVRNALAIACLVALAGGCFGWMATGQRVAALTLTLACLAVGLKLARPRAV